MSHPAATSDRRDEATPEALAVRVLYIEDDEDDYLLTREVFEELEEADRFELVWMSTFEDGLEALCYGDYDVCLLDYRLGARDGIELLGEALVRGCNIPIILLTGLGSREVDRAAMDAGAADYLVKGEISPPLLERSIRHSIERRRAELQRERAIQQRDEIQRIVAHDLRGPLNTIGMLAQLMERKLPSIDEAEACRKHLALQRSAISKMNRLIEDLLDIARIERGELSVNRSHYSPAPLVEEVVEFHHVQATERGISLEADVEADLPDIDADIQRIQQVFSNLVGNALKFTPEGGRIELRARRDGDAVRFAVADTGQGIPADQLPHLFDRFWQADKAAMHGVGLGLAIAKAIVEAHDGRLWVDSAVDQGTTFSFTLPVAQPRG